MVRSRCLPILVLGLALGVGGCRSNPNDIVPSPLPPGLTLDEAQEQDAAERTLRTSEDVAGQRLDEVLAVVEGEPLTLRQTLRRLGVTSAEADSDDVREEVQQEIQVWATARLFEKAFEREGITIPAARLDKILDDNLEKELEAASEETGTQVTRAQYLADKGLTLPEWRAQRRVKLLEEVYFIKLLQGLGQGSRPQVDLEVTPSEARRLYHQVPELSEKPHAFRIVQFEVTEFRFDTGERDRAEIDRLRTELAQRIEADFRAGTDIRQIAQRYDLGEEGKHWRRIPAEPEGRSARTPDDDTLLIPLEAIRDKELAAWLGAPQRRPGDAKILSDPLQGVSVLGVLRVQHPRRLSFREAHPTIVRLLRLQRVLHARNRTLIQLLRRGDVVWPQELADRMLDDAREAVRKQREAPEMRGIRLR